MADKCSGHGVVSRLKAQNIGSALLSASPIESYSPLVSSYRLKDGGKENYGRCLPLFNCPEPRSRNDQIRFEPISLVWFRHFLIAV